MTNPIIIPTLSSISEASQAIDAYVNSNAAAALPAFVRQFYSSPVDKIVRSTEALYACADKLDNNGLTLVAQLASFATTYQWHSLGRTARGLGVMLAMRRRLGDTTVTQTADQDPAPDPSFAPKPAASVEPPAASAEPAEAAKPAT